MKELNYEERFQAACSYAQSMHDEKCISICNELLDENPQDGRLYALMGEAALNMREHKVAYKALSLARIFNPENPFIIIRQADALMNLGHPRRAQKLLNAIRGQFIGTRDEPLWAQTMGDAIRCSGDYDRAADLLHYAIQEVPNWSIPWGSLAILETCRHKYSTAAKLFEKQYELKPNWKSAHELGINLPFVNRWKEAYEYWRKAAEWRWEGQQFEGKRIWDGRNCETLMVYGDGGLGDTIQYSRYLLEATKRCKRVLFSPQKRHREIVSYLELPGIEISDTMDYEFATWLMILPGEVGLYAPEQAPAPIRFNCDNICSTETARIFTDVRQSILQMREHQAFKPEKLQKLSRLIDAFISCRPSFDERAEIENELSLLCECIPEAREDIKEALSKLRIISQSETSSELYQATRSNMALSGMSSKAPPSVAISWTGDFKHANDKLRSVRLKDFAPLVNQFPHIHWFTVSPGEAIQREIKESGLPITQYSGTLPEAVQRLCNADAYVGVDTGHAHVLATQGKPTHIIFKEFVDSRWGGDKDTTGYYNKARLYRSYRDGWGECLNTIAGRLHEDFQTSS